MKTKDGGPAFPHIGCSGDGSDDNPIISQLVGGITVRDYFAASALSGFFSDSDKNARIKKMLDKGETTEAEVATNFAKSAYTIADYMIAERDK